MPKKHTGTLTLIQDICVKVTLDYIGLCRGEYNVAVGDIWKLYEVKSRINV